MIDTSKVISLLAAGVGPSAVAAAVGCDPSYISQLLSDDSFREELAVASAGRLQAAIDHDASIESLEAKALRAIEQKLPFVRSPMEAAKIFQVLNNSKKRAQTAPANNDTQNVQMVTIVLPPASSANIKVNSSNQVIEVADRTMATLPSKALPALSDAKRAEQLLSTSNPLCTVINGVPKLL